MIRIERPAEVPEVLRTKGVEATDSMKSQYDADAAAYDNGTKTFVIQANIYGHETVKDALKKMQHGKCGFCESNIEHIGFGDVEHFRPKKGWDQGPTDPLERPGYYWLAYQWSNLLLSCTLCNQRFKKNHFPLRDPLTRCRSHNHALSDEDPLLIDPTSSKTDPQHLISFREEVPHAVGGNPYGIATIEFLGLDREKLSEQRRGRLELLRSLHEVVQVARANPDIGKLQKLAEKAREKLLEALSDGGEYAGAVRANGFGRDLA